MDWKDWRAVENRPDKLSPNPPKEGVGLAS